MSGLETLPPDQRAVLQLILVQGRGYADLAATLKLDVAAVRTRAHASADALGLPGADQVDADTRGRVVDYLLGQQDDGERIVTFATLGEAPAACRWAQALRERLAGIAADELPEVPASAAAGATNGSGPHAVAAAPAAAAAPAQSSTATAPSQPAVAPEPARSVPAAAATLTPPPAPATPGGPTPPAPPRKSAGPEGSGPSRLGGAILIAGAAALAIVLAIVLIGGDDDGSPSSTNAAQSQPQTQARASTQPTTTPAASGQGNARIVAQVNLSATPAGGSAIGVGLVQQAARGRTIAIQAQRLPANGAQDIYAVWLQGSAGAKFLGFVPRQVRANGSFTVTAALPANASSYSTVLVTREGVTAVPTTPGTSILSGPLRLTS